MEDESARGVVVADPRLPHGRHWGTGVKDTVVVDDEHGVPELCGVDGTVGARGEPGVDAAEAEARRPDVC